MFPILERLIYGAEPMWALNGTKLAFIGVCNVDGKVLAGASCVQDKFAWSGLYTVLLAGAALMGALTAAIARGIRGAASKTTATTPQPPPPIASLWDDSIEEESCSRGIKYGLSDDDEDDDFDFLAWSTRRRSHAMAVGSAYVDELVRSPAFAAWVKSRGLSDDDVRSILRKERVFMRLRSIDPDAFRKLWHKADAIGGDLGQVGDLSEVPPLDARSALLASALDSAPVSLLAWLLQRQASSQAWGGATASLLWTALGVWLWVCAQVYSASAAGTVGLSVVGGALVETESQHKVGSGRALALILWHSAYGAAAGVLLSGVDLSVEILSAAGWAGTILAMILTVSVVFMRLAGMEAKRVSEGMVEYLGRFLATPSKHKHANVTRDARMSEEEDE